MNQQNTTYPFEKICNKSHLYRNCDEFGLFYRCLPDKTLPFQGDKCFGSKTSKERLIVLVECNADGYDKLPRCIKNVYELPLHYETNKQAWMTSELFLNWIKNMKQYFQKQNKKIALILDNCTAHPSLNLANIELIFFAAEYYKCIAAMRSRRY